jgi:transposase InsO family protein
MFAFIRILAMTVSAVLRDRATLRPSCRLLVRAADRRGGCRRWASAPILVRDRDSIYGEAFSTRIRELGVCQLVTPPQSPRANAFAERAVGTLRRDYLDHVPVWNERHATRSFSGPSNGACKASRPAR